MERDMRKSFVAPFFAALAFVGVTVVFALEMSAFRSSVMEWASHDLESRTEIAVSTLREPLRTGDFAAVHAFSRQCAADDVRLSVFGKPKGGLVFDSLGGFTDVRRDGGYLYGKSADAGAFEVMLGIPLERVLAPFSRSQVGLVLAVFVGMAGMLFFFVSFYRQRVRIRELSRLEEFRRRFIADVSHEIKTPLTGILGAADMLGCDGAEDAGMRKSLVAMITKESKRLNALVQRILDLARLEREGESLNLVETDLVALAGETVEALRPRAEAAGMRLSLVAPETPCVVKADAVMVSEALSNLVENAIRHSGSPDVVLSVAISGHVARVVVEDHGAGVPPEHVERIFDRFHRVDPARAAESGGAGLGLAIVRSIARLHGGDVTLDSVAPHGCRFTMSIPE